VCVASGMGGPSALVKDAPRLTPSRAGVATKESDIRGLSYTFLYCMLVAALATVNELGPRVPDVQNIGTPEECVISWD